MSKYKGELVLLIVSLVWGTGYVATAETLKEFEPFQLLAIRFSLSAALLAVIFFKKVRAMDKITAKYAFILGALLFSGFALQTVGLIFTTPGKSAFISVSNVVIVPFIGVVLYRRRLEPYYAFGAFTALIGLAFLTLEFDAPINLGDAMTLLGTFMFGLHIFYTSEFMSRGLDVRKVVVVQMGSVGALAGAAALIFGQTDFSAANVNGILLLIYMAVFTTSFCFLALTWAQSFTSESKAAVVLTTECLFAAIISIALRYEPMTLRMAAGAVFIIGGVLITELKPWSGRFDRSKV